MEKQTYAKIFKGLAWALMIISIVFLVVGFVKDFGSGTVDLLLNWAYIMIGIALCAVVVVGLYIAVKNNPKSLVKMGLIVVGAVVLCLIAYLLAPGSPAVGFTGSQLPTQSELKLTDTMLNLTYILGVAAILAIIAGEVLVATRTKKA